MSTSWSRFRLPLLAGTCLLTALGVRSMLRDGPLPGSLDRRWPAAEELDSLARYLVPAAEAPMLDEYDAFIPAAALPAARPSPTSPVTPPPGAARRVGAILISGDVRMAIVDEQTVRLGQRLPGGAVVTEIESDHVVIRDPDGTLRTLRVTTGEEGSDEE